MDEKHPIEKDRAHGDQNLYRINSLAIIMPNADIDEISLDLLNRSDENEAARLLYACVKDGMFYLNLRDQDGVDGHLLRSSRDIYQLSKALFDLSQHDKMRYDIDFHCELKLNGYKPLGRNKGGLRGEKDGFESYAIAKDVIFSLGSAASHEEHPEVVTSGLPLLRTFAAEATAATTTILASLSTSLGLAPGAGFEAHHRPGVPSPDMLRLLRYAAQPEGERGAPQNPHTDLGSLTVLFAGSPGLQRRRTRRGRGRDERGAGNPRCGAGEGWSDDAAPGWEFVGPREGCAVVNVGDGMVALTGGLLHSCLHRVVPLPGRGMEERYSFAWMARAEEATVMTRLGGGDVPECEQAGQEPVTSGEWLRRKFAMLRK